MKKSFYTFTGLACLALFLTGCGSRPNRMDPAAKQRATLVGAESYMDDYSGMNYTPSYSDDFNLVPRESSNLSAIHSSENTLASVHFSYDSSAIEPQERTLLQGPLQYLLSNQNHKVLIEGHCDWYGSTEYNLALGDRRAHSVKNYLVQSGANPMQIETVSKGSLESTQGLSKADAVKDRRADVIKLGI